jgi:hypothetical protein
VPNTKIAVLAEISKENYSLIFKNVIFAFRNCEVRQYNVASAARLAYYRVAYHSIAPFLQISSRGLGIVINCSFFTCRYRSVVLILKCPKISLMYRMSTPFSRTWVAKECRMQMKTHLFFDSGLYPRELKYLLCLRGTIRCSRFALSLKQVNLRFANGIRQEFFHHSLDCL